VSYAGLLAGRGVVVVVHGVLRTTYEPVTASVRVGQAVAAGQVLGRLATGHCPTGCLHWGLLRGDVYLDPVQLVGPGPSRLLPVDSGAGAPSIGVPAARRSLPSPAPLPADDPPLALRSADRALGAGALVALLAGLALLVRPRRPPDGPAAPAAGAPLRQPAPVGPTSPVTPTGLVDLSAERSRRRPEVA
jgi:murein DD-endopeptidase MepM/ murein hydrolase activator NlpD